MAGEIGQADQLQRLLHAPPALGPGTALQLEQQFDIARHGSLRQERGILKDIAERPLVSLDRTRSRCQQPGCHLERGRLSASGLPDDGDQLTGPQGQRHVTKSLGPIGKDLRDMVEDENRVHLVKRGRVASQDSARLQGQVPGDAELLTVDLGCPG